MSSWRIPLPEGELLNILGDISPLAWRRFRQRSPEVLIDGAFKKVDRPEIPPAISFRFEHESQEVIEKLKELLLSYNGKIKWVLDEHKRGRLPGTNWMICPSRVVELRGVASDLDITSEQYLAQYEPEFGLVAYEDIVDLTEYIRKAFFEASS